MSLVSVCIPTYSARRLPYLRQAVASALAQTHSDIEVILSDNGHDEPIRAFGDDQRRADPRVRYRRNDPSLSLAGNFNAALHDAKGEYVLFNGDDDRLLPSCVETLLAAHRSDTVVTFANHHIIDHDGERSDALTRQYVGNFGRADLAAGQVADPVSCAWRNSVPLPSSLIRVADAQRLGINPGIKACDFEFFIRLAGEGGGFVFLPEFLAEYRVHPASASSAGVFDPALLGCLDRIPVPGHVEPLKRRVIAEILVAGVSAALKTGDFDEARALIRHRYYPTIRDQMPRVLLQKALASLPAPIAAISFDVYSRGRRAARRVRRLQSRLITFDR